MEKNYSKIIKLYQTAPNIVRKDDKLKFNATLLYKHEVCGDLYGETIFISTLNNDTQVRARKLYFDLCCGLIISEGISNTYNNNGLLKDTSETIIVGGTKKFEGVTGKIISKRLKNEEYEHTLCLNNIQDNC
jgi:hypothetical protein